MGVLVSVEVTRCETFSQPSRQALGVLLLTACGLVRFARAAVEEKGGQALARFEVRFSTAPSALELTHALAALSVACRLCAQEAKALQDEEIAGKYLAIRGWFS